MASIMETLNSTTLAAASHPFYPLEVEIANYLANEWSMEVLLTIFTAVCASIFLGTKYMVNRVHPHLPSGEKAAIWWFVLCMFFLPILILGIEIGEGILIGMAVLMGAHSWNDPSVL
jgi:hypothetical protein